MSLSLLFLILTFCMAFIRIADAVQFAVTEGTSRMLGKHLDALIIKLGIIFISAAAIAGLLETI